MTDGAEASQAAAFGLVCIDRESFVRSAAGVRNVIFAASDGMARPGIHQVEDQRRVYRNIGMQAGGRLPRAVADPRYDLSFFAARIERHSPAVAKHYEARVDEPRHFYLQAFY